MRGIQREFGLLRRMDELRNEVGNRPKFVSFTRQPLRLVGP